MANGVTDYPVKLTVDYADRTVDRVTSFFRIFTAMPIGIVAVIMTQALPLGQSFTSYSFSDQDVNNTLSRWFAGGAPTPDVIALVVAAAIILAPIVLFVSGFVANLFNPVVLMLVFRRKYPRWWYDFYAPALAFQYRVLSYLTLLTDVYPSTDEEQGVHIGVNYPDAQKDLSQGLPLIKWFLAIPHYVVLAFVIFAAFWVDVVIWFAILFTGKVPRGMFDFVAGTLRWSLRVQAYAVFHFTDKYPPFSLD